MKRCLQHERFTERRGRRPGGAIAALLGLALLAPVAEAATSVTFQPAQADSWLKEDKPTDNYGTGTSVEIKSDSPKRRRVVVRFDMDLIPSGATIKSATLSLFVTGITSAQNRTYGAHRVIGTPLWTETGVTWNSIRASTSWTTPGGDFNSTATSTATLGTSPNVWLDWAIGSDVQAWVDGSAPNMGTLIKDANEDAGSAAVAFSSKEGGTAANWPKLVVTYLLAVRNFTATAGDGQNTLDWVLPGGGPDYDGTLILRRVGTAPTATPTDGVNHAVGATLADGSVVALNDRTLAIRLTDTGLTNGTTYCYQAFARDGAHWYSGASATICSTPTDGVAQNPEWSYTASVTGLAPPGLTPNGVVATGYNDGKLHGMSAATGLRAFVPFATGGAIQARPPIIPLEYSTTGLDVAYVTSQDGAVYAVNANTGAQVWKSATLGDQLQGGAAVWLQAIKALAIGGVTRDAVFVGTRNSSTTNNKVYALNADTGAILWTFNGSGSSSVDIVVSTPAVDYGADTVWVTSRAAGGTGQPSVWKLAAATGAVLGSWNLGDVDASPVASADGAFVYVGTNAGTLQAIRVSDGNVFTHTPATGTGGIKGLPWPVGWVVVGPATPDTIVFSRDTTVHAVSFDGSGFGALWTTTLAGAPTVSPPVDDFGGLIYVGASDGKLHQLSLLTGADEAQRTVGDGTATVGHPSLDTWLNRLLVGATDGRVYAFDVPF